MDLPASPACTVYFDGACPVCRREIAHYRAKPGAENLRWVDASVADAYALGPDLDGERALARFHVRSADGSLVSGAAAFASLWQQLPAYAWLGRIAAWPPVLAVLEAGYRAFLRLRPLWRSKAPQA
jgi:predicted DCC family thiol-disulfide oxidoreductase YuxK